jgi:protein gp37
MSDTSIEWTQRPGTRGITWNPTTGCDKISAGCDHCYALTLAKRLKGMGSAKYQTDGDPRTSGPGFGVATHLASLDEPYRWKTPRTVFVNSMSDLFHAKVPVEFVKQVFAVMNDTPKHTYQILTKRSSRLALLADRLQWTSNIWIGASVEDATQLHRIDDLRQVPAWVRFISAEPLIGPLTGIDLTDISWLIAGGESGPGARPIDLYWVRHLIAACRESGTAPFVKQLGSVWAGGGKGNHPELWPADLRVRCYPQILAEKVSVTK